MNKSINANEIQNKIRYIGSFEYFPTYVEEYDYCVVKDSVYLYKDKKFQKLYVPIKELKYKLSEILDLCTNTKSLKQTQLFIEEFIGKYIYE